MAEIAASCGVSRATVSYVLNHAPKAQALNPGTVQRIEKKARELGYLANDSARAIKTGRTRTIALFTPPLRFESNILVVHGAALAAAEAGYQLKYMPVPVSAKPAAALVEVCRSRMIGGAVCLNLPRVLLADLSRKAKRTGLRLAQVGDCFPDIGDVSIVADHESGARQVIDHLTALGHRHIALLTNDESYSSSVMRLKGFEHALQDHGIDVKPEWRKSASLDPALIQARVVELLRLRPRPTAIVCDTDPIALTALHTVIATGLKVPDDISITGFVNLPFCDFTQPSLTSVEIPAEMLGRQVASALIARLEGQSIGVISTPKPKLIVRKSSGPASRLVPNP